MTKHMFDVIAIILCSIMTSTCLILLQSLAIEDLLTPDPVTTLIPISDDININSDNTSILQNTTARYI